MVWVSGACVKFGKEGALYSGLQQGKVQAQAGFGCSAVVKGRNQEDFHVVII